MSCLSLQISIKFLPFRTSRSLAQRQIRIFLVERHGESSVVRELDKEERVNELARMISGEHISEEAINFAKGLLKIA